TSRNCPRAGSRALLPLRQLDRGLERAELAQALLVLGGGIRVGDDAAARLQVRDAVVQHERADGDARVELALPREGVADRARVDAAAVALELRDDLHRPHLRRPRDRAGGEAGAQELERRGAVTELADHL